MSIERSTTDAADTPPAAETSDGRHLRGHRRQRALIDAARDLFVRHGYKGTTLEAIIARAGGSRETIYRAFGGKRGLFSAIVSQVGEKLAASVVAPSALGLPPREGLTRMALQLVEVWRSDEGQAINRVVVSEGLDAPDLLDAWYSGGTKLSIEALDRYLQAQQQAGRVGALDTPLVARQFVMLLMGELAFPLISGAGVSDDAQDQIQRCVDLILRAYETAWRP